MKRLFIAAAALLAAISCSSDRAGVLKVYNWSDYIGEGIVSEFEQWYKEKTGEDITVVYQTFDVNETMLSKIEKGHEDYDLVCPSDYIIERMLNSGLLLPLDFASIPDSINYIVKNRSPYIEKMFKEFIENGGVTGYTQENNIEKWHNDIVKSFKGAGKKNNGKTAVKWFFEGVEKMNESVENAARFATYMRSRQMGS